MHQRIVDALLARDPDGATLALRQHMANAVDNIRVTIAERDANILARAETE